MRTGARSCRFRATAVGSSPKPAKVGALVLRPYGRLSVVLDQPLSAEERVGLTVSPEAASDVIVRSLSRTSVVSIERLPAGTHDVFVEISGRDASESRIHRGRVDVVASETTSLAIDTERGSGVLEMTIEGPGGAPTPHVVWFVLRDRHTAAPSISVGEIESLIHVASERGVVVRAEQTGAERLRIDGLVLGPHTVCAVPMWESPEDPGTSMRLMHPNTEVTVQCQTLEVVEGAASHVHIRLLELVRPQDG
jgi:hypothetical protein